MNRGMLEKILSHPMMTTSGAKVFGYLIKHLGGKNHVGASYAQIAKEEKLSQKTVARVCEAFCSQGFNVMIRTSKATRKSLWMMNPEICWNDERRGFASGMSMYQIYRIRSEKDETKRIAKAKAKPKKIPQETPQTPQQPPINNDIMIPDDEPCWFDKETGEIYYAHKG
jgi:hypothetical protein